MTYETENGFSALLDALESHYEAGRPLRKSHAPAQTKPVRVVKISRSKHPHPISMRVEGGDRSDFAKMLNDMDSLNKSMQHKPRTATLRLNKKSEPRKTMENFNAKFQKAITSGELTPDEICRVEAHRNRRLQGTLTGLI